MQSSPLLLRSAEPGDIPKIVQLNDQAGLSPWSRSEYRSLLDRLGTECLVAEQSGRLIGFCLTWRVGAEIDLLKIAVDLSCRRAGVGQRLLRRCLDSASADGVEVCFLEVRRSNQAALGLYHRFGFEEYGVRKGYYSDPPEDAVMLRCRL